MHSRNISTICNFQLSNTLMLSNLICISLLSQSHAAEDSLIQKFLTSHCLECHSDESAEVGFRLDAIGYDLQKETTEIQWLKVFDNLKSSQMPPADARQPSKKQRDSVVEAIGKRLRDANLKRRGNQGRAALRRLTRFEYENTLHDLLDIKIPLSGFLPEDASANGFDKVASAMRISAVHLEQYMAAAEAAIDAALIHEPPFQPVRETIVVAESKGDVYLRKKVRLVIGDGVVLFGGTPDPTIPWKSPAKGTYRFQFTVEAYQSTEPLTCEIRSGDFTRRTGLNQLVGHFDIEPEAKRRIEFDATINAGESVRFNTFGIDGKPKFNSDGETEFKGPGIWLGPLEIEGPLEEEFPPESHRRLFNNLPLEPVEGKYNPRQTNRRWQRSVYHEVVSDDPRNDAVRLLNRFAERAFRHPVDESVIQPYILLVHKQLDRGKSFEQAMRTGFIALLCSSDFLFVTQPRFSINSKKPDVARLNDHELASRLSYFLWSSMPDKKLIELANTGSLSNDNVLKGQVERMLADLKSSRFINDFVDQWLDLKLIDFTTPDRRLYPDFDDILKVSMVNESRLFFKEILERNLSVSNFIDSDFIIINERLATHYGIAEISGQHFRRVPLQSGSHRGGVLTQASVLKVTADGTKTSPVLRGVWALERIIGKPVPPPPPGVPGLEPDIRGSTTIRQQLAKHREVESCSVCHRRIDPLGFAMESYDVIGGWRQQYRTSPSDRSVHGQFVKVTGYRRDFSYRNGPNVDPADKLPGGKEFSNMDELKLLLSEDPENIARCLTEKLVTYSTGCGIEFVDRVDTEKILARLKPEEYRLKSMIHEIVQSDLFRNK